MSQTSDSLRQLFGQGRYGDIVAQLDSQPGLLAQLAAPDRELAAVSLAARGRVAEAEAVLRPLADAPQGSSALLNLGVLLLNTGRLAEARPVLERACRLRENDPNAWFNLGLAAFAAGAFEPAAVALERAAQMEPGNAEARLYCARALQEMGRLGAAQALLRGWNPGALDLAGLYELAQVLVATDDFERAEVAYRAILERDPAEAVARCNLAALCERGNRLDDAEALLAAVPEAARNEPLYLLARGKLHGRREAQAEALACYERALQAASRLPVSEPARERFRSEVEFERGRVLDRLGRHEEAFASFMQANGLARDAYRRFNAPPGDGGRLDWLQDTPGLDAAVARARANAAPVEAPIFLVGFPRSGTTLLDRMLDAHPGLQVLEEKPALEAAGRAVHGLPGGYPAAIGSLTEAQLAELRRGYWATVGEYLQRRPGTRLVDKYPLNLARLHLAMAMFPRAKWLFAIRHPADVVLSCFMQNFRFTDATHGFWSLPQSAAIYEQIMTLWLQQRARLKPDCLDLRYEDLIADVEGSFRRVLAFLELPWDERVLGYRDKAREQRISNPSYRQVIEPVYRTAEGRWRKYRRWLEPELARLAPLAVAFGYDDPRGASAA